MTIHIQERPSGLVVPAPAALTHPNAPLTLDDFRAYWSMRSRASVMDFFAGGGGFSLAAAFAGAQVKLSANHNTTAVQTHGLNFPDADHVLGDLSVADPKRYPKGFADILVCSPECRKHSRASNHREAVAELSPWNPDVEAERSRCTMWCPQRWAEYHRFKFVICENVTEVTEWNQFSNWVREWDELGYHVDAVFGNSAFFGVEQSRDRVFFVMTLKGEPRPNLDFSARAWCWTCERETFGVQRWKKDAARRAGIVGPVGKWGPYGQWQHVCETCQSVVSPYVVPAERAIDLHVKGPRICDRPSLGLPPIVPNTIARLTRGVQMAFRIGRMARSGRASELPMWLPATTTAPASAGLDLLGAARGESIARAVGGGPAPTVTASAAGGGLYRVGLERAFLAAYNGSGHNVRLIGEPAGTQPASDRHALLVPSGGSRQDTAVWLGENPASTRLTRDTHAVVELAEHEARFAVEHIKRATYRMLAPHETVRLMALEWRVDGTRYAFAGSGSDITRQAGNAVTPPLPANILHRVLLAAGA
jgi:DNA (cytosine-5)-methyltransferase 1